MLLAQVSLIAVHILLYTISRCIKPAGKVTDKVSKYLYFNGTIRLLMESYMDLVMFALINIKDLDWSGDFFFVTLNNWISISLVGILIVFPFLIVIVYVRNVKQWKEDQFQERYGAFVDGANLDKKDNTCAIMIVPISFLLRRLSFCLTLVFWIEFFWG